MKEKNMTCNNTFVFALYVLFVLLVVHYCALLLSPKTEHYDDFIEEGFV